jgi:hypothetical protein
VGGKITTYLSFDNLWKLDRDIQFLFIKAPQFYYLQALPVLSVRRKENEGTLVNLLKPAGHVMHQQFNIQQLYVLPTLYLCVLYLSENKQRLVPLTA